LSGGSGLRCQRAQRDDCCDGPGGHAQRYIEPAASARRLDPFSRHPFGYLLNMPPRGVKKGTKRARQYEKIKQSEKEQGRSEDRAEEIAARTVNKARARSGESRTSSRTSTRDMSSSRRGGQRSGTSRQKGRTRDQLYNEAKKLNVEGRSSMDKSQLQRAVDAKKR
jgi:hypothetical protein